MSIRRFIDVLRWKFNNFIISFRWRFNWFKKKEIWLEDLPTFLEEEIHVTKMDPKEVASLSQVLNLVNDPDFLDNDGWYEKVHVIATTGFDKETAGFLKFSCHENRESGFPLDYAYIRIPLKLLLRIAKNDCVEMFYSTNPFMMPVQVVIHYGKGEKPFWMEESFIKARTDPMYQQNNLDNLLNPFKGYEL